MVKEMRPKVQMIGDDKYLQDSAGYQQKVILLQCLSQAQILDKTLPKLYLSDNDCHLQMN